MCVLLLMSLAIHLPHVPHASLRTLQGELKTPRVHSRIEAFLFWTQDADLLGLLPPHSLCGKHVDCWWTITDRMPNLPEQPNGLKSRAQVGLVRFMLARTPSSDIPKFTQGNPKFCLLKMFVMINLAN